MVLDLAVRQLAEQLRGEARACYVGTVPGAADVLAAFGSLGIVERNVDPAQARLNGHHGSLTPAEQLVPMLVYRALTAMDRPLRRCCVGARMRGRTVDQGNAITSARSMGRANPLPQQDKCEYKQGSE